MGYTLLRTTSGKRFASFLLSLLVAVSPILCSAHTRDSIPFQEISAESKSIFQAESVSYTAVSAASPLERNDAESSESFGKQQINPVLAFTVGSLTVKEDIGAVNLRIELLEGNNTRVEADIVFLPESGTASFSDISDFSIQTIMFSQSDAPGTVKSVRIPIADDREYERAEKAVFRLQNISAGSIAEPSLLTLEIQDDDMPNIVINEIFANPLEGSGDANADGVVNTSDDQFIELVNNEGNAIDLGGWTLSDDFSTRFTFPGGTVLPAGTGAVVFGGGKPAGYFGGALLFTAGDLGIDNAGDILYLRDEQGNVVEEARYDMQGNQGQSLTRDIDINGSLSVRHSEVSQNGNRLYSPGTKTDGTSFGSRYALRLEGGEGWRLLSSPTRNTTFEDLFANLQMKTASVSNQANEGATIYEWGEGGFRPVDDFGKEMEAGRGYAVYFHEDDDPGLPGIQGGFPKVIYTDNPEYNGPVSVSVSSKAAEGSETISGNEGWNLMGNPFGEEVSVSELLSTLRRALQVESPDLQINGNLYVWDPTANGGNGDYLVMEENKDHKIMPFQAFWIKISNAATGENVTVSATLKRDELRAGNSNLFKESNREEFGFILSLGDDVSFDDYQLAFNRDGAVDTDIHDAFKLHSMNNNSLSLYSLSGEDKLMKNVLPYGLSSTLEIPLDFDAGGRESLSFGWEGLNSVPDNWKVTLTDKKLNKEINLRSAADYRFTVPPAEGRNSLKEEAEGPVLKTERQESKEPRFILTVSPGSMEQANSPDIPESVKLNPNYPNPFNPATTISYELKEDSEVLLSIWNIVGQRVVTLVDGMKEAGEHTATWNASEMPSGIYIAQLEVAGEVFIRKMTLIK